MRKKKVIVGILLAFFLIFLAFLFTYPAVFHLSDKLIGDGVDNYQFLGFQYVGLQNVRNWTWPFIWTDIWRYPIGFDFSRGFDGVLGVFIGIFLNLLTNNAIVAYNLHIFIIFSLNFVASFFLFKYISKSTFLGLIGGIIYGFSFFTIVRSAGHPNIMLTAGFPLLVLSILRLKHSHSLNSFLLIGISIIFIMFSSLQYLALVFIFIVVFTVISFFFLYEETRYYFILIKDSLPKVIISLSLVTIVFLIFFNTHLISLITKTFIFAQKTIYNPTLINYFLPNQSFRLQISKFVSTQELNIESAVFIGFIEPILFIAFFLSPVRRKVKLLLFSTFIIFFLFSLGTYSKEFNIYLPYGTLVNFLPFSAIPETGRFYVLFYLIMTIAIVLALKELVSINKNVSFALFSIIMCLVILERLPANYYLSETQYHPALDIVKNLKTKAVLDIPLLDSRHDILPIYHGKKIVSGYIHWSADNKLVQSFILNPTLNRFVCDEKRYKEKVINNEMSQLLKENEINAIIIHKDYRIYWEDCKNVLYQYTKLFPHLSIIKESTNNKFIHYRWIGDHLSYQLFFSKNGYFELKNIHFIDFNKNTILKLKLNNKNLNIDQKKEIFSFEYGRWTKRIVPSPSLLIKINAGDLLTIEGDKEIENQGFISIWYSFKEDKNSIFINYESSLKKIYEDERKEVWTIN